MVGCSSCPSLLDLCIRSLCDSPEQENVALAVELMGGLPADIAAKLFQATIQSHRIQDKLAGLLCKDEDLGKTLRLSQCASISGLGVSYALQPTLRSLVLNGVVLLVIHLVQTLSSVDYHVTLSMQRRKTQHCE